MKKIAMLLICLISLVSVQAQKTTKNVVKKEKSVKSESQQKVKAPVELVCTKTIADVYGASKIYFYGYDFSHMKFVESKREEQGDRIVTFFPAWEDFLGEHRNAKYYQKALDIDTVVMNLDVASNNSKLTANPNLIIGSEKAYLNGDSIQKWIKKYDFKEKDGIGYIMYVDCFYKPEKTTVMTFVFFDLYSKKVLLSEKYESKGADGYGLKNFWGFGMQENLHKYQVKQFKKEKKKFNEEVAKK